VKILDKYLLKSFLTTFATVFVILFFIFVLQVVWLFISELAGKDLDIIMIGKFLLFKMPSVVPLVLPLSVLLASIMTFGSLAENYEFAAMKSSGISLQRAMRPLIYFILILTVLAFLFANNVIPYAEYKFVNFRRNIAQVKPAMAIAEGQFSEIGSYNIKVEKKHGENGRLLDRITIHKKSFLGDGTSTVIKAKNGELVSSENSNTLQMVLKDGNYYEDIIPEKYQDKQKIPFAKSTFKRYVLNIDLSKLNNSDMDEGQITNTNTMLTVNQLRYTLDSLQKNYVKDVVSYTENVYQRTLPTPDYPGMQIKSVPLNTNDIAATFKTSDKAHLFAVARSSMDAIGFSLDNSKFELEEKQKNINEHWIALYDKFVIAFSCILMFFIGAPLGAIIRKGGLGLPIVFAILIFITFHFINTFGKKVAQENGIEPVLGCWMSTMVLAPLAILLTKRATEDRGVSINLDWLTAILEKLFPTKTESELALEHVSMAGMLNEEDAELLLETDLHSGNPVLAPAPEPKHDIAPKIDYKALESLAQRYDRMAWIALALNFLVLGMWALDFCTTPLLKAVGIGIAVLFLGVVYASQRLLARFYDFSPKRQELPTFIVLLGGFPFFSLFYVFNRIAVRELVSPNTK
jgi:lipopolysaccharide export system permease protein